MLVDSRPQPHLISNERIASHPLLNMLDSSPRPRKLVCMRSRSVRCIGIHSIHVGGRDVHLAVMSLGIRVSKTVEYAVQMAVVVAI